MTIYRRAPASSWAELSWGHVTSSAEALAVLGNLRLSETPWLDDVRRGGVTWGRNGAHMAAVAFQQPFRLLLPAANLLPPGPMRPLPSGPTLVKDLDPELPLLLLPVRLATRFHRGNGPGARPTELWLRIFPDSLHADGHAPALTRQEVALGQAYWERLWRVAGNAGAREDSQRWLVRQLGAPRAAWVIAQTAPANPGDAPAAPVPRGRPLDPAPVWPEPAGAEPPRPTLARLLPDRWHVTISATGEISEEVWSDPVRRDLAMAPNVADIPEDGAIRELFESQDLLWMADFEAAEDAGMAVRIPLSGETRRRISSLVVFGVRDRDPGAEEELAGLLDAHRFTSGLEIVTHGTPTNSTATVEAGFTDVPPDLDAYISRQLSAPEAERPQLEDPASLGTAGAADALALAFGLDGTTAFDVAEHAGDRTGARAEAMNRVLWPATWGYFLNTLLATGGTPVLAGADLDWLRSWFADWVRGPGLLPAFRAGEQPYGVLPVGDLPWWEPEPPSTRIAHLKSVVGGLRGDWLTSSGEVPGFWATVTRTPEEEAVAVASVLGAVPHPTAFRLRRALGRYERFADQWQDELTELESRVDETNDNLIRQYEAREADIRGGAIDVQSSQLAAVIDDANAQEDATSSLPAEFEAVRDQVDVLWADVNRHRARSETRFWSDSFSDATLPDPDDPSLWYVEYGDDGAAADGTFPDLKLVPGGGAEGDPVQLAASLRGLAADARSVTSTERPEYDHAAPKSLLRVLIEHGIEQVHHSKAVEIAVGLDRLADMCEAGAVDDPVGGARGPAAGDAGPRHPSPRCLGQQRGGPPARRAARRAPHRDTGGGLRMADPARARHRRRGHPGLRSRPVARPRLHRRGAPQRVACLRGRVDRRRVRRQPLFGPGPARRVAAGGRAQRRRPGRAAGRPLRAPPPRRGSGPPRRRRTGGRSDRGRSSRPPGHGHRGRPRARHRLSGRRRAERPAGPDPRPARRPAGLPRRRPLPDASGNGCRP